MSLLSYNSLLKLVECNVIDSPIKNIKGTSIDITLGCDIFLESRSKITVDLKEGEDLPLIKYCMGEEGHILCPGEFILATTVETFNLPNNIAAEYKLKSSLARAGLQHMLAGWCDPTWNNSKLTLELKNNSQYNNLLIKPGMKIGQMVFWECDPVPEEHCYSNKGQYNNQETVTRNKGVK